MDRSFVRSPRAAAALGAAAAGCLAAAACSSAGGRSPDGGTTGIAGFRPCAIAERVGRFAIWLGDGFTGAAGEVTDGVVPLELRDEIARVGDCRLLRRRPPSCDPACASPGEVCNIGNKCTPAPMAKSVGTVTLTGLAISPIVLTPNPTNFYSYSGMLPHPGFDDGARIELEAEGGSYQPFTLTAPGVPALELTSRRVLVQRDEPVVVTWTPPARKGPARVLLTLQVGERDSTPAILQCDVTDSGSYDIPADLVERWAAIGGAGEASLTVLRSSADSAAITAGCVQLSVESAAVAEVLMPVISCNVDGDCPAGQTCQPDLICR